MGGASIGKRYRALATGDPARRVSVDDADRPRPHPLLGPFTPRRPRSSPRSRTCGARLRAGNAIVEASIPTGRAHQIRIHLAAAGHPLVGDPLYAAGARLPPIRDFPAIPAIASTPTA